MGVSIDVHCHLLQADGVERETFVKAWLGLNALPDAVVRRIINFVLAGGVSLSPALRKAIEAVLSNAACRERLRRFYVERPGLGEPQFPAWWAKTQPGATG